MVPGRFKADEKLDSYTGGLAWLQAPPPPPPAEGQERDHAQKLTSTS